MFVTVTLEANTASACLLSGRYRMKRKKTADDIIPHVLVLSPPSSVLNSTNVSFPSGFKWDNKTTQELSLSPVCLGGLFSLERNSTDLNSARHCRLTTRLWCREEQKSSPLFPDETPRQKNLSLMWSQHFIQELNSKNMTWLRTCVCVRRTWRLSSRMKFGHIRQGFRIPSERGRVGYKITMATGTSAVPSRRWVWAVVWSAGNRSLRLRFWEILMALVQTLAVLHTSHTHIHTPLSLTHSITSQIITVI